MNRKQLATQHLQSINQIPTTNPFPPNPHQPDSAPGRGFAEGVRESQATQAPQRARDLPSVPDAWWRNFFSERSRCQYRDPSGRQCRSERQPGDPTYCLRHRRVRDQREAAKAANPDPIQQDEQLKEQQCAPTWEQLFGPLHDLRSATGINYVLGRLLLLKTVGVVGTKDAAVVAYICQLLLQTLPLVEKEAASAGLQAPALDNLRHTILSTSCLLPHLRDTPPTDESSGE